LARVVAVPYEVASANGSFEGFGHPFGYVVGLIVAPLEELATMQRYGNYDVHLVE
jgi:hypothetical protein